MATIKLNLGFVAIIDDHDIQEIEQFNWCVIYGRGDVKYAATITPTCGIVTMHRMLMRDDCPSKAFVIDHINGDGLDNRRCNLRFATKNQNSCNTRLHREDKVGSVYRGVEFAGHMNKTPWRARIRINGTRKHLGYFETAEQAGRAYDEAAVKQYGELERTNFRQSN